MKNNKNISRSNNDNNVTLSCNKNNYMNNIRTNSNSHNNTNSYNNNQHFHFHLQPQHTVGDISELVNRFKSDDYDESVNPAFPRPQPINDDNNNNNHTTNHYNNNNFHFHFEAQRPVMDTNDYESDGNETFVGSALQRPHSLINELVNSFKSDDGSSGWLVLDPSVPPLGITERIYESNRRCFVFPEYIKKIDGRTQCPLCDELMQIKRPYQVYGVNLDWFYCDGCNTKIENYGAFMVYHCECNDNGGYVLCEKCVIEECDLANFPACRKILTQNKYIKTIHALKQRIMQRTSDNEKIYEISIDPPLNITGQRGRFWIKASSLVTTTNCNKYKYKCLINNAFLAADTAKMQIQHMIYRELRLDPLMQQQ